MSAEAEKPKEMRLCWKVFRVEGSGRWWPKDANFRFFKSWMDEGNAKYGAGTHWIEERDA